MDVHFSMFQNAVESQASEEQKDYWLPKVTFSFFFSMIFETNKKVQEKKFFF